MEDTEDGYLDDVAWDRLPAYRRRAALSETNMSTVYLAEDRTHHDRLVALKVQASSPGLSERFERESRIAVTLKHPNVVPVYAAGEIGELRYLAMRYVQGRNLRQLLNERDGVLSFQETLRIVGQVAAALDSTHALGLIHRDVKPANIMIEEGTGHVYLCDFGIAKDVGLTGLTAAGVFVGTPDYSSPEQVRGGTIDHRTDVYSLAVVIQHCLTGSPSTRLSATPAVNRVLAKAFAPNPADRYDSCAELVNALATARARRTRAVTITAVGVVAVVTAASVLFGSNKTPVPVERIPEALRGDCTATTPTTIACHTGEGQEAVTDLFADQAGVDQAYTRAVQAAGVTKGGDCTSGSGGEHRYPLTGKAKGRVLCYTRDGVTNVVWTDAAARTVTRMESRQDEPLLRAWTTWTGAAAAFPTEEERATIAVASGANCARANLDAFPTAVAAVTCTPLGMGPQQVSYYRFASLPELRGQFTGMVDEAKAPVGVSCASAPGFLGTQRHDWLGTDIGQLLCRPAPNGALSIAWTTEPLSIIGVVTGADPRAVHGWWSQWHLAPLDRIVAATNAQSSPPFPTAEERKLLDHVPPASRKHCVRTAPGLKWQDVAAVPAVGIACGRTSGAELVAYYQFQDVAAMRTSQGPGGSGDKDCRNFPEGFNGESSYSRGGSTGSLRCYTYKETGERGMSWTDERLAIRVVAHRGTSPVAMIDWWTHDAGPI
ncbi:serine/threonine protein kinase [Allokutzneria sp. A3M-2-11 16]|uniref:serine/threonine-protein kinase n=1 Tax=Allokutzneria sp. A3M-2-11 16 TaxID=2962043 RepID=UPI0020B70ECA|nr:serine/threonine-protein kinase [Allokutzneria sp. A3M-2-11 16]MCP3803742.1 serine/threonine protein kinase [Allokutzneria sp. A3M-2-11 16]